jgi:hypothetical protein
LAINDQWQAVPESSVRWRITDSKGVEKAAGDWPVTMPEDSVTKLGVAEWTAAGTWPHELHAEVRSRSGELISENVFAFQVSN